MGLLLCSLTIYWCLPHAGGGVSEEPVWEEGIYQSSPRRWGCFHDVLSRVRRAEVFPTQVGVFPQWTTLLCSIHRLPHAGGGVSDCNSLLPSIVMSSPRRWGCFSFTTASQGFTLVFPTQVGVFLGQGGSTR